MRTGIAFILVFLVFPILGSAQTSDTIRVCTYNILEYGEQSSDRDDELRMILDEIRPTVLFVQEITRMAEYDGYFSFLPRVINELEVSYEPIVTGWGKIPYKVPSQNLGAFVDTSAVELLWSNSAELYETLRGLLMVMVRIRSTGEKVLLTTTQWKADNTTEDRVERIRDAEHLIQFLEFASPNNAQAPDHYVVAGDLNVYSSNEEAYQLLLHGDSGVLDVTLVDPISTPGSWNNNASFAAVHTQSTRARTIGAGVRGGLDDRFDQILVSESLLGNVQIETYTAFGNDGNHYNDSINAMPNTAVSPEIAQALHDASDHLPVFVDIVFGASSGVENRPGPIPESIDLSERKDSDRPGEATTVTYQPHQQAIVPAP